jgi:adenylosuccinate lyase
LENVVTWHERDLTQSSAERFIIPEACILTDYILFLTTGILTGLQINEHQMLKNIKLTQGRMMSEAVMIALTKKGMSRQEAYELLRNLAAKSEMEKRPFKEVLLEARTMSEKLSEKEIDEVLNPKNYLGTVLKQIKLMIEETEVERRDRGLSS